MGISCLFIPMNKLGVRRFWPLVTPQREQKSKTFAQNTVLLAQLRLQHRRRPRRRQRLQCRQRSFLSLQRFCPICSPLCPRRSKPCAEQSFPFLEVSHSSQTRRARTSLLSR